MNTIIVQEQPNGTLAQAQQPADNTFAVGNVNHSYSDIVRDWADADLAAVGLYRVAIEDPPAGKEVESLTFQHAGSGVEAVITYRDVPLVIPTITRRQLILALMRANMITAEEATAAATSGAAPATVAAMFDLLDEEQRTEAYITWASMSVAERGNSLVSALAATQGMTEADVDAFFLEASSL